MRIIKLFEEFSEIGRWKIYSGLGGGFGGAHYIRTFTGTKEQAEKEAYYAAIEEYDSYEGLHGLRTVEDIMEEDGIEDYDEAQQVYNDERESWLDYYVKPDDGVKESKEDEEKGKKTALSNFPHLQKEKSRKKERRIERSRKEDPDGVYPRDDDRYDKDNNVGWQDGMGVPPWLGESMEDYCDSCGRVESKCVCLDEKECRWCYKKFTPTDKNQYCCCSNCDSKYNNYLANDGSKSPWSKYVESVKIKDLHKKCSNIYNYDEDKEFIKKDARIRFSKR